MAEARASRWYFGGLASCGAACCTHPLDLLKVSLSFKAERAREPKAPGTVPGLAPTGRLLRPPLDCAPGNYRHAGLSPGRPALRRRAWACRRHYARLPVGSGGKSPGTLCRWLSRGTGDGDIPAPQLTSWFSPIFNRWLSVPPRRCALIPG